MPDEQQQRVTDLVTVRPVHSRDVDTLVEAEREIFPDRPWDAVAWWSELAARPRREYLVLLDGDELLGYAGLDHQDDVADIMTVAVRTRGRGRGHARTLLDGLDRLAGVRGAAYLMLEVRADNAAALALYAADGFCELSRRRRYYQPDDVDAVVMRRAVRG